MPGSDPGMGIGPSRQDIERCANMIRRGSPGEAVAAFKHQFEIWHRDEPSVLVSHVVHCAHYWIDVRCWNCRRQAAIDLRRIKCDDYETLADIVDRAKCRHCRVKGQLIKLRDS